MTNDRVTRRHELLRIRQRPALLSSRPIEPPRTSNTLKAVGPSSACGLMTLRASSMMRSSLPTTANARRLGGNRGRAGGQQQHRQLPAGRILGSTDVTNQCQRVLAIALEYNRELCQQRTSTARRKSTSTPAARTRSRPALARSPVVRRRDADPVTRSSNVRAADRALASARLVPREETDRRGQRRRSAL